MTKKLLILHGAGMDMRGKAQIEIFGPMTLPQYEEKVREYAKDLKVEVDIFHSNIEGELINRLYEAHDQDYAGAVFNPAGFMCGYRALNTAVAQVGFPVWELHMSNPAARGVNSEIATTAQGVVTGFGVHGYYLAMQGVLLYTAS